MLVTELHYREDARVHRGCEAALQPQRHGAGPLTYEGDETRGLLCGDARLLAGPPHYPAGGYAS